MVGKMRDTENKVAYCHFFISVVAMKTLLTLPVSASDIKETSIMSQVTLPGRLFCAF